jgi:hypothetical protein
LHHKSIDLVLILFHNILADIVTTSQPVVGESLINLGRRLLVQVIDNPKEFGKGSRLNINQK